MSEETLPQTIEQQRSAQQRSLERTRPPTTVPGYDPVRFLGAGAYGEVWVAVERNTGRRVAIKFYTHRGGLDWSLLSREVEKLSFLFADRYVVQLIEVGWDADPPYYVMEHIENGSLADRLRDGPLPIEEAINVFRDVATGLVHAHGKGVLHCDLKPANVLLDQDMKPRLADFGQSRMSTEQKPALGTLFYMAPEQADMKATPDARWDVYALGALLYTMLTGDPPYRSESTATMIRQGGQLDEQLARYVRLLNESPRPKQHRSVPGVDRSLAEIIDRCLAVNPLRRFANPQAVLDALHARQVQRSRRPLLLMGAVLPAALVSVMSFYAWTMATSSVDQSEAALTERALESNRFAARFVAETVAGQIARRWDILEQEAADSDLRDLIRGAVGKTLDSPEVKKAEAQLVEVHHSHPELSVLSWILIDTAGRRLGRSPPSARTENDNFSYRDYFHGLGRNIDVESEGPMTIRPIEKPHRSQVIASTTTGTRVVVFTVPVWDDPHALENKKVIGVLGVSVEIGRFSELRADHAQPSGRLTALYDLRANDERRKGMLLEHPHRTGASQRPANDLQDVYATADQVARFERLRELTVHSSAENGEERAKLSVDDNYEDAVGGEFERRWLAAFEPVLLDSYAEARDVGWMVVVQEPFHEVIAPARNLGRSMIHSGMVVLGVVLFVLAAAWAFTMLILNDTPYFRWTRVLRQQAGLPRNTASGGTSSSSVIDSGGSVK